MHYTIVGLRETGELAVYDRSAAKPDLAEVQRICHNFEYSQVLVMENSVGGDCKRYEYDAAPRVREVEYKGSPHRAGGSGKGS